MKASSALLVFLTLLLASCATETEMTPGDQMETPAEAAASEMPEPGYMAHHLFNVPDGDDQLLREILSDFNQVFRDLGHPEIQYRVWRVADDWEQQGEYAYIFFSLWPSRDVYAEVHQAPEYRAVAEKYGDAPPLTDEIYNRYVRIDLE